MPLENYVAYSYNGNFYSYVILPLRNSSHLSCFSNPSQS